jgi:MYXO-CTERM domain-containing protein
MGDFMKVLLGIAPVLLIVTPVIGQTEAQTNDTPHHSYGWIGLFGLAGLAGLRRAKSLSMSAWRLLVSTSSPSKSEYPRELER